MILSRNFLKDYVDLDDSVSTEELAEAMTKAGSEYDSVEKMIPSTKLIIGKVLECKDHPDSDHLHLCKVDIGNEVLDIVCGAPNVRAGIKVIVAQIGSELPGDFKIAKKMTRGYESNGMICALYEIGLDKKYLSEEDKNGIHILGDDAVVGKDPIEYLQMNDSSIDFDLTANRGDLLSILGMAYEVGAIYDLPVKDIDLSHKESGDDLNKELTVKVETENCKAYLAKRVKNVVIKESPKFIQNRLIASGIRPINNVVDISNYVMLETGQPLHFFDSDKLGNTILVRMAKQDEKMTTLDGIERDLSEDDILITNGTKPVALAGVMGGLETEIEEDTKNVTIESAIFDGVKVRLTSKKIVRSESSNRFEKGLDPNRTYMAIERACKLLEEYADGEVQKGTVVYDTTDKNPKDIDITIKDINDLLGTNITVEDTVDVFRKLGFESKVKGDVITVTVPTRRIDISIKEDLIEEVGRIYGVDNIQGTLPNGTMRLGHVDKTDRQIREKLYELGLNETLTYALISKNEVHKYTYDEFDAVELLDPMTEERNVLRYSLIPSLYRTYDYNKAHSIKDVSIFEIGKGFWKINGEYGENKKLCALMTGDYFLGVNNKRPVNFFVMKGVVEEVLDFLGYGNRYSFVMPKKEIPEFHPGQVAEINVNGKIVGILGKLHPSIEKNDVYVMEINLDTLLDIKTGKMKFREISIYPTIKQDIALVVDKNVSADDIMKTIKKAAGNLLVKQEMFDMYQNAVLGDKKSVAFSLTFGSNDKTLTDDEINPVMEKIIKALESNLKAELRK